MSAPGNDWYPSNAGPGRSKEILRQYMDAMR